VVRLVVAFVIQSNFLPIEGVSCCVQVLPGVVEGIRGEVWDAVRMKESRRRIDVRISTKLIGISVASVVIVSGLVLSLTMELRTVWKGNAQILQGPVMQADQAREAKADFQMQVQEWKDVLLRGQNPADLAKYSQQFHEREAKVKEQARTLAATVEDPATRQMLNEFLAADDVLSVKYQAAYEVYLKQNFDFKGADRLVRGQDRPVSALFDKIAEQLNARVLTEAAEQRTRAIRRLMMLLIVVGVLLLIDLLVYFSSLLGILKRLGQLKAVSDRLAVADIEGLSVDISGHDEIGAIGESLKGVAAAIEELLAVPSQETAVHSH
jgi:methyl-accepting chemotaxis protein